MKRTVVAVMVCLLLCFAAGVSAEIKQEVDEFDGSVSNESLITIANGYQQNTIPLISLNNDSDSSYPTVLILGYFSDKSYIFSHSPMDLKIDDKDIIKAEYLYQQPEYLSYYPIYKITNAAIFDFSGDVKNRIITANTITLRAYSDVGDIVYTVPDYMLQEWKYVLSTPLIAGYQSLYKNITWPKRGSDDFYCIDICDENWNVYPGLQGLQCRQARSWSPKDYINKTLGIKDGVIKGFKFNWRVWSESGYGGDGFEGSVICE